MLAVQPPETEEDGLPHGLRELEGVERAPVPARVRLKDLPTVDRLPQHLLEDERVPFRPLVDEGGELRAHVVGAQDRRDHLRDLRLRHRLDRDRVGEPAAPPGLDGARQRVEPVELVASVGREEQHTALREAPGCVLEELTRGAVGPVDVVEDDEEGVRAGPEVEQRDERLEEAQPRLRLVTRFRRGLSLPELWEHLGQLRHHRAELGAQGVEVLLVELRPDRLDEGQVGERELGLRAASPEDVAPELARPPCELAREAGLPDPGFPGEQNEAAVATVRREQRVLELGELVLPSDEDRSQNATDHPAILPSRAVARQRLVRISLLQELFARDREHPVERTHTGGSRTCERSSSRSRPPSR